MKHSESGPDVILRVGSILAILSIVFFSAYSLSGRLSDDAMIYLRYFENFQNGHGLTYNAGERYNGLTSPAYTLIMTGVTTFWRDYIVASTTVSAIALAGAAIASTQIFSDGSSLERAATGIAVAAFSYFYTTLGLETSLYLLVIALSFRALRTNPDLLPILVALAFTVRGEGIFLGLLVLLDIARRRRLPAYWSMGVGFLIFLSPLIFNYLYFGSPLADTVSAKYHQGRSQIWGHPFPILRIAYLRELLFPLAPFASWVYLAVSLFGFTTIADPWVRSGILLFLVATLCFYIAFLIPNYHWYYGPFVYLGVCLFVRGAFALARYAASWIGSPSTFRSSAAAVLVGGVLYGGVVLATNPLAPWLRPLTSYIEAGRWIDANTAAEASIGIVEIGYVGWYAKRPLVDILGLVNPHNAVYVGDQDFVSWLKHYQPDYILLQPAFPRLAHATVRALEESGHYARVQAFEIEPLRLYRKSVAFDEAAALKFVEALTPASTSRETDG